MLGCGYAQAEMLLSLFGAGRVIFYKSPRFLEEITDWLDERLKIYLLRDDAIGRGLKNALITLAWSGSSAFWSDGSLSTPQYYLAHFSAWRDWLDEEGQKIIQQFIDGHWDSLIRQKDPRAAVLGLTPQDKIDLILKRAPERKYLPDVKTIAYLFPDDNQPAVLRKWLLDHQGEFKQNGWLSWVKHFGFVRDAIFRSRIEKMLDDVELRSQALTVLESI